MKLTKSQLKRAIKEELSQLLESYEELEASNPFAGGDGDQPKKAAGGDDQPKKAHQFISKWADTQIAAMAGSDEESKQLRQAIQTLGIDPAFLKKIMELSSAFIDVSRKLAHVARQKV